MLVTNEPTPPFALTRFVEDVRVLAPVDGYIRHDWLPDGRTSLVLRVLDGGRRGDVSIAGPRTRALFKDLSGVTRAVVIKFKPGWSLPLFGVAASKIADRIVPLDDLWGRKGSELYARLVEAQALPAQVECVSRAISYRVQRESSSARLARRAAQLIEDGHVRVDHVAEKLGVTARHLRRAFIESVGVGPKDYARAVRLQRAVRLATTSDDWGRIAAEAGYYDQAHFITDFRQLVGLTPGAFARRAREADLRCE